MTTMKELKCNKMAKLLKKFMNYKVNCKSITDVMQFCPFFKFTMLLKLIRFIVR